MKNDVRNPPTAITISWCLAKISENLANVPFERGILLSVIASNNLTSLFNSSWSSVDLLEINFFKSSIEEPIFIVALVWLPTIDGPLIFSILNVLDELCNLLYSFLLKSLFRKQWLDLVVHQEPQKGYHINNSLLL